ncbi:hypothetical protein HK104_001622 [Borealophlyctis nickersoniae]|nr:hypothetical protein HK104_001622 [Borealophlyctis nickersoniae]
MSLRRTSRLARPISARVGASSFASLRVPPRARPFASAASSSGGGNGMLWLGLGAAVLGGGYYYMKNTASGKLVDHAVDSAKRGDFEDAARKTKAAADVAYPELKATLTSLLGKESAEAVSTALDAVRDVEQAASNAQSSSTAQNLRAKAAQLQDEIRAAISDAVDMQKRAVKELGPAAKAHYEAVKNAMTKKESNMLESLENGLAALKREGKEFYREASESTVGDEVKARIRAVQKKAEDLKKQAQDTIAKERK